MGGDTVGKGDGQIVNRLLAHQSKGLQSGLRESRFGTDLRIGFHGEGCGSGDIQQEGEFFPGRRDFRAGDHIKGVPILPDNADFVETVG